MKGNLDSGINQPEMKMVSKAGKVLPVLAPAIRIEGQICNLDWLNFVLPMSFFGADLNSTCESEYQAARTSLDDFLERIFGSHVTQKLEKGRNFYDFCLSIGDNFGYVLHGGQRNTVCFMISGTGCSAFKPGWESRLYGCCSSLGKITRADLAFDDFEGARGSIYEVDVLEKAGMFTWAGHGRSEVTKAGNWDYSDPNNKGLTLYIGAVTSGKRLCCYEKGKQLGQQDSKWVRYEVRFSNKDRILPWTILINPSHYFAGSYPLFENFSDKQARPSIKKKSAEISYEASIRIVKRQFGQYLNMILAIEGNEGIERCIREGIPKRVKIHTSGLNTQTPRSAA